MRAIVIGAGRGQRLMPTTKNAPKCYAEVAGRRILDWIVEAFAENGVDDIVFIGGYLMEKVQAEYPGFTFRPNEEWPDNNILASLMWTPGPSSGPAVSLIECSGDIRCVVDTKWKERYEHRTDHPMTDGEKVTVADGHITRVHRDIDPDLAHGEFTGVAWFSEEGGKLLREHYHRCRQEFSGRAFREAPIFEKAYLIHLLQEMIEHDVPVRHADVPGEYWEIDTQQDYDMARADWSVRE